MSHPSSSSTLAPPSLLDHRRRTRSFNGTDSAPVVILPSLPAIHPPGVEEEHPRIPQPLSLTAASESESPASTTDTLSLGGALRVPATAHAAATLRSKSPMGRGHPHPLPSPEHDGLAGFAVELVHAAGSSLIHPYVAMRSPAAATGLSPTTTTTAGRDQSPSAATTGTPVPLPTPATTHSLRALAHQLAGPIMERESSSKQKTGPLALHRETLMALKDQLNAPSQAGTAAVTRSRVLPANMTTGTFPPGLTKRFSAPSLANKGV